MSEFLEWQRRKDPDNFDEVIQGPCNKILLICSFGKFLKKSWNVCLSEKGSVLPSFSDVCILLQDWRRRFWGDCGNQKTAWGPWRSWWEHKATAAARQLGTNEVHFLSNTSWFPPPAYLRAHSMSQIIDIFRVEARRRHEETAAPSKPMSTSTPKAAAAAKPKEPSKPVSTSTPKAAATIKTQGCFGTRYHFIQTTPTALSEKNEI